MKDITIVFEFGSDLKNKYSKKDLILNSLLIQIQIPC